MKQVICSVIKSAPVDQCVKNLCTRERAAKKLYTVGEGVGGDLEISKIGESKPDRRLLAGDHAMYSRDYKVDLE